MRWLDLFWQLFFLMFFLKQFQRTDQFVVIQCSFPPRTWWTPIFCGNLGGSRYCLISANLLLPVRACSAFLFNSATISYRTHCFLPRISDQFFHDDFRPLAPTRCFPSQNRPSQWIGRLCTTQTCPQLWIHDPVQCPLCFCFQFWSSLEASGSQNSFAYVS